MMNDFEVENSCP